MAQNGIFCLEGEWDSDLRKRTSVLPVLELLERMGQVKSIHRDVSTTAELSHYLGKWAQQRYADYRVLYLATHGDKGLLYWCGKQATTLEELAELLGDSAQGRYLYLGSCLTLFDERQAKAFVEATGVAAIMGYRKEVDWLESASFEVVLLAAIANHHGRPATLFKRLMQRHSGIAKLCKFVVVTKNATLRSQDHTG